MAKKETLKQLLRLHMMKVFNLKTKDFEDARNETKKFLEAVEKVAFGLPNPEVAVQMLTGIYTEPKIASFCKNRFYQGWPVRDIYRPDRFNKFTEKIEFEKETTIFNNFHGDFEEVIERAFSKFNESSDMEIPVTTDKVELGMLFEELPTLLEVAIDEAKKERKNGKWFVLPIKRQEEREVIDLSTYLEYGERSKK